MLLLHVCHKSNKGSSSFKHMVLTNSNRICTFKKDYTNGSYRSPLVPDHCPCLTSWSKPLKSVPVSPNSFFRLLGFSSFLPSLIEGHLSCFSDPLLVTSGGHMTCSKKWIFEAMSCLEWVTWSTFHQNMIHWYWNMFNLETTAKHVRQVTKLIKLF